MRSLSWLFCLVATLSIWLGSGNSSLAQALEDVSGNATDITTANCSAGACTPAGPNGGAGPNPATIAASVSLCQVGGVLRGMGTGTGFQFGKTYISLLYKNGNVTTCSRFPDDVPPTLANASNPDSRVDNDFASMMLGIWQVKPDGSATLVVAKQAPATGLRNYKTVSVREIQLAQPASPVYRPDLDPAPQLNALRACGSLALGPACYNVCDTLCAKNWPTCNLEPGLKELVCGPLPTPAPQPQ